MQLFLYFKPLALKYDLLTYAAMYTKINSFDIKIVITRGQGFKKLIELLSTKSPFVKYRDHNLIGNFWV